MDVGGKKAEKMSEALISFASPSHAFTLCFHPSEQLLALSTVTGDLYFAPYDLSNPSTGVALHKYRAHRSSARSVCFSSEVVLSVGSDCRAVVSDLNPKRLWQATSSAPLNVGIFFSSGRNVVVAGDDEGLVTLWDTRIAGNAPVLSFHENSDYVSALLVRDHSLFVAAGDARLALFDVRIAGSGGSGSAVGLRGKLKALSDAQEDELRSAAFSTNPRLPGGVLTGDSRGVIGLWKEDHYGDVKDRVTLLEDTSTVDALHSLKDGRVLTAGDDGIVRILSLFPHKQQGIVGMHDCAIESLAVDEDLKIAASVDEDLNVKIWKIPKLGKGADRKAVSTDVSNKKKKIENMQFFQDL